ncbi:hypothetical protein C8R45DRAFT_309358 [Mycena sanguinolenta]|nr:hypothetical protein C8R45DRAFT_309358 [Mycena sanguinolenta]
MDSWMQPLRTDSDRTRRRDSSVGSSLSSNFKPPLQTSSTLVVPRPTRLRTVSASNASLQAQKDTSNSSLRNEPASRLRTVSESASNPNAKKRAEITRTVPAVVESPDKCHKCPNLCCDEILERPAKFVQLRSEAMIESRTKYCVDSSEASCVMAEISPTQVLYTSCKTELGRLKCMLAARPFLGYKAPVASATSKPCIHACCSLGFSPPLAALPRLRHVVLQLQILCREMSQYLGAKRSLVAPIRRLPPELLQDVFLFAALSDTYALSASSNVQKGTTLGKAVGAIRLAHVCSYWRVIALDTGQLWATILLRLSHISGITQLNFHIAHAKSTPLTIVCHEWAEPRVLKKLARRSHRWRSLTLRTHSSSNFKEDAIRVPLLQSLRLDTYDLNTRSTIFRDAPALRRVTLTAESRFPSAFQPFTLILPWRQLTFLTLQPLPFSLFSDFVRECPQLLYFNVGFSWISQEASVMAQTTETQSSLRKLVLRGALCQEAIVAHSFPHLLSLSIQMHELHPRFFAFLARSSHLQMLSVLGWSFETKKDLVAYCSWPPAELLLATPSLRIMHIRNWHTAWSTALVTANFYAPLVVPLPDDPFTPVAPRSLVELNVAKYRTFGEVALLAFIKARMERDPSFDPYGIEKARVEVENIPFDPEAELDYLNTLG